MGIRSLKAPTLAFIAKYPKTTILGLPGTTTKCWNSSFWVSGGHKHEPRTQEEPLKSKWLTFGDQDLRKAR